MIEGCKWWFSGTNEQETVVQIYRNMASKIVWSKVQHFLHDVIMICSIHILSFNFSISDKIYDLRIYENKEMSYFSFKFFNIFLFITIFLIYFTCFSSFRIFCFFLPSCRGPYWLIYVVLYQKSLFMFCSFFSLNLILPLIVSLVYVFPTKIWWKTLNLTVKFYFF